jgi:HupE / UreJ protein
MQEIKEGIAHITDFEGYDHMLYLGALCAPFVLRDYKKVVVLATAFTIGHSVTLAASAAGVLRFSSDIIEMLISISIGITGLANLVIKDQALRWWHYIITIGFGLIHGMGFSSYFRMMYSHESDWIWRLFQFNVGVELGQLMIISVILLASYIAVNRLKLSQTNWKKSLSWIAIIMSGYLIFEKIMV